MELDLANSGDSDDYHNSDFKDDDPLFSPNEDDISESSDFEESVVTKKIGEGSLAATIGKNTMECGCAAPFYGPSLANSCGGNAFLLFMSLLDNFIQNKCDLSDVCNRVKPKIQPELEYDFVVIGGGSAGATVAGRLSNIAQWKVLLLEAGGDEPPGSQIPSMMSNFHGDRDVDWNYKTEPESHGCLGYPERRCDWTRAKVLGGCSVTNGMMYMRGVPRDYDNWSAAGNSGWSYNELLPYFMRIEGNQEIGSVADAGYHGISGPMTVNRFRDQPEVAHDILHAAKELGYPVSNDLNGINYIGFAIAQSTTRNGSRLSTAKAFLRPIRDRTNLHVMINSTVTKLLFRSTKTKKKIAAVEFVYKNKLFRVKVRREAILSAGAVNSPKILLQSGVGPQSELNRMGIEQIHELPGVGHNLHNHVTFHLDFILKSRKATNILNWESVMEYLNNRKGPMSSTGMSQVTARINTKFADPMGYYPDLQLFFSGYLANCGSSTEFDVSSENKNIFRELRISPVVLHTKSRGYISLKSKNLLDPPLIYANYLSEPEDVATLIEGVRIAQNLSNTKVLKEKYKLELVRRNYGDCATKHLYDSDDFWQCAVRHSTGPENHQAGSCKMGPSSDKSAVVDNNLQVHGLIGVRVMDASIMPLPLSGNTDATCVLIAERGVEFIIEKWLRNKQIRK
ncbi:hypothetical protein RN001_000775 [Aquatica leii]|uniref:Glucose-methanol-choline oxidoreductase N-terminal domain-containing protein n=1 Tax=Aquatica leii TaxID=1421715 RepID=A0AAN7SKT2_9COLE|nr:hypothetical protein RN001_000775 [Aquatica leii]